MTKVSSANSKNDESRDSITIDDETFYVGDCILVKGDGVQQPFVSLLSRSNTFCRVASNGALLQRLSKSGLFLFKAGLS